MYKNILKKDLKRKKAMNAILLVFVILATMFVSSSVNNILSVTTALDGYLSKANAPDYLGMTMDKSMNIDVESIIASVDSIDSWAKERVLFFAPDGATFEGTDKKVSGGTSMVQSDRDMSMNYFLSDNSILESVEPGKIYVSVSLAELIGLDTGDKITLKIADMTQEFTLAGTIKDAVFGASMTSVYRYIISGEDMDSFLANEGASAMGGYLYFIHTSDLETTKEELAEPIKNFSFQADRANMKFFYVFDMIVTGALLVVSLVLIAIAFVVLRFTIGFTMAEEFREIGVMKAIGIPNVKIRGLYMVKYAAISLIGSAIGLVLSFPFGNLLMGATSKSIVMGTENPFLINFVCAWAVVGVILLFCYGCTGKVKKMTPIDAIRNGQTGERFRKKSIMSMKKSKLGTSSFLALNDIVSSPKRFGIVTLTFVLCLSLLLMLSSAVFTMKGGSLYATFGLTEFHVSMSGATIMEEYMMDGGQEMLEKDLAEMEEILAENGMDANCTRLILLPLPVSYGDKEVNLYINQTVGETMDRFEYTAGTAPQNTNEVAITKLSANKLGVAIGDTVTVKTCDGEKEYIITAFFQSMSNQGDGIQIHQDERINYAQAMGCSGVMIRFNDDPTAEEVDRRIEKLKALYPDVQHIKTCAKMVEENLMVVPAMDAVKILVTILTAILTALVTLLMERSFIAKEQGEIALLKAIGTRNGKIYAYHVLRFVFVAVIAVIISELIAMPLTKLCFDPIFKMMGMETGVKYLMNPVEMFLILPAVVLGTTAVSAFLTALYTRKIKSSDTANIE